MIRPLTIATFLLAGGSGLYLYQSKHEVQVLDRTIERAVHDTAALREQSRLLAAEWTMLNDPERLRQFSDTYLSLRTITPSQFTSVADLDNRLPAVRAEEAPHGTDDTEPVLPVPMVEATPVPEGAPEHDLATLPASADEADEDLPVPPMPVVRPVIAASRAAEPRVPERVAIFRPAAAESQARPAAVGDGRATDQHSGDQRALDQRPVGPIEQRPIEQRPVDQRAVEQHGASRLADRGDVRSPVAPPPRQLAFTPTRPPLPVAGPITGPPQITLYRPVAAAARPGVTGAPTMAPAPGPAQYPGSLLGMAHGSMPPAPRPTPVNASYNSN